MILKLHFTPIFIFLDIQMVLGFVMYKILNLQLLLHKK